LLSFQINPISGKAPGETVSSATAVGRLGKFEKGVLTMKQSLFLLLCPVMFFAPGNSALGQQKPQDETGHGEERARFATSAEAHDEAVVRFLAYLNDLDVRKEGKVRLVVLQQQLTGISHSELKSLKLYADWDQDRDSFVSIAEAKAGVMRAIDSMVAEKMALDADGDGALSPTEYLLGVPPREREDRKAAAGSPAIDDNGWNQRQRSIIRSQDRNQDGIISREEIRISQASRAANGYQNLLMLNRARGCDKDGDGRFSLEEFALMNGVPPGTPIPDALKSAFSMRGNAREHFTFMQFMVALDHAANFNKQDIIDHAPRHCASFPNQTKLTADAAAQPLIQLLDRIGRKNSGRVPLADFLKTPGMQLGEGRGANRFHMLDANRDGFVSPEEVRNLVSREIASQVDRLLAVDADGNGALSREEFALSLPSHKSSEAAPSRPPAGESEFAGSRFAGYDRNGDGQISREEATKYVIASALSRNWTNSTIPRLTLIDRNGDNFIDKSEFDVFNVGMLLVMADNRGGPGGTPRIKTENPEKVPIERMTRNLLRLDAAARHSVDQKLKELEQQAGLQ
jgi:Ca2+-binding EF-hand superfamily protein